MRHYAQSTGNQPKAFLIRLLWFGLGLISSVTYNQLMWQKVESPNTAGAIVQADQEMKDHEDEALSRILDEMVSVRRDYQRMKASRDLTKERLEKCQIQCPAASV
jgi:hypothetical protein